MPVTARRVALDQDHPPGSWWLWAGFVCFSCPVCTFSWRIADADSGPAERMESTGRHTRRADRIVADCPNCEFRDDVTLVPS